MEARRLLLDIETSHEPVTGRVRDEAARCERTFTGWLGLLAALEALAGSVPAEPAGRMDEERAR